MIPNTRISGEQTFPYSESDIRVNFNNPNQVIAAANAGIKVRGTGQGQFYSSDRGATWHQTHLPLNASDDFQSDPSVDWTSDGTAWATTIGFDSKETHLRIRAFKSTDGGQEWIYDADASGTQTAADRARLWVDHSPTSPYRDNIYVTWHNGQLVFVSRRTGPTGAWETPVQVSGKETAGTGAGGDVKTNGYGDVFVFWPDSGGHRLFVSKSTVGGKSFAPPVELATTAGSVQIPVPAAVSRAPSIYVTAAAYRTTTKDVVCAAWMDLTREAGCRALGDAPGSRVGSSCKTRVWFARSTDGGKTWSAPAMVNDQPSKNDQFHPRLTVDDARGILALVYYDTVRDPGRLKTDLWMQMSADDGRNWSAAFRVTTAQTDETITGADVAGAGFGFGDQYGDYIGLTGHAGTYHACWTDRRDGKREEIWSARFVLPLSQPWLPLLLH